MTFAIRGNAHAPPQARKPGTAEEIFRAVEKVFDTTSTDLRSPRRARRSVLPRFALCLLFKEFTDWSLPRIGLAIGGRDHTTILHAIGRAQYLEQKEPEFAVALQQARSILREAVPAKEGGAP